jgi:hypothetical protein
VNSDSEARAPQWCPSLLTARLYAQKLSENMGHPVVVDSRAPGGGGSVGGIPQAHSLDAFIAPQGSLTIDHATSSSRSVIFSR